MPTYQRIAGAAGLLVLGGLALVFLGPGVTRCLGPLGRTEVEAIRDSCITPSVGLGMPIGAAALVAASLLLVPIRRLRWPSALVGAVVGALLAAVAYGLVRPISFSGPTSTGEFITVPFPFDWWALLAASIAGAGVGLLLGGWLWRGRGTESNLSRST